MAIRVATRWKPDAFRTSLETTISGFDPAATPPTGGLVRLAQCVAYDDAVVTVGNYQPGDPATERNLVLLYAEPITLELSAFAPLSAAQSKTLWDNALTAFGTRVTPAAALLVKAVRSAMQSPPVVLS